MSPDHYEALGVDIDADRDAIRAAYLAVMRRTHPDHQPDDIDAATKARQANAAWEVLGNASRRDAYDRLRAVRRRGVLEDPGVDHRRRAAARSAALAVQVERAQYRQRVSRALLGYAGATFVMGLLVLLLLG